MTRILYGLCGIGIGHAIRSRVILDYLLKHHEVMILTSKNAYHYLKQHYSHVENIEGFEFVFKNNTLINHKTLLKNLYKINPNTIDTLELTKRKVDAFNPQLVISDMETYSMYLAKWKKIPLINLDNQHFLLYGKYHVPKRYFLPYLKALFVMNLATRKANHYFIITFPGVKLDKKKNITPLLPIVRKEIVTT